MTHVTSVLLCRKQVSTLISRSKSWIYKEMSEGRFPKPITLSDSGRSVAWISDEIVAWIESRKEARNETIR